MNARVQTDKQVLQHELFPDVFYEVAPASQLYENNEADAQTTRYVAKDFGDEIYSNDLQSLHLTSSSSASTVKEEEKQEESREIKSLRNIF